MIGRACTVRTTVVVSALAALLLACTEPCATPEEARLLQQAAAQEGAVQTESGLVFLELRAGSGPKPAVGNHVQVHYEGRLADGTVFDSSYERGVTAEFPLDRVIPGWTEGLQLMAGGGKARLTIPADLAYGRNGRPGTIPPCAPLIFEVELLGIYD